MTKRKIKRKVSFYKLTTKQRHFLKWVSKTLFEKNYIEKTDKGYIRKIILLGTYTDSDKILIEDWISIVKQNEELRYIYG